MRPWAPAVAVALLLVAPIPGAVGNHEPVYKAGVDDLAPGEWQAHFVWLRSDHFNFVGEVWWRFKTLESSPVDTLFFEWPQFQRYREGADATPRVADRGAVGQGWGWQSHLESDLPYVLVFRNAGDDRVRIVWQILAEIDYRRWQSQPPGPTLNLTPVDASPPLDPGAAWAVRFDGAGVYLFRGQPQVDMTGLLEVRDDGTPAEEVAVTIANFTFRPEILRVSVGTTVSWTNDDFRAHSLEVLRVEDVPWPEEAADPWRSPWLWVPLGMAAAALALGAAWALRRPEEASEREGDARREGRD